MPPASRRAVRRATPRNRPLQRYSDEMLLDLRLCDLGVSIENSWLTEPISSLYEELASRQLRVRPHFWLSTEWFCPSGVPGIAMPFFLAHPRLMQLEKRQMLEVEGGTYHECMKLLRHEMGHALQHAFILHRKKSWQRVFGKSSTPYPDYYRPNPASKRYVVNLELWYAQSHPDEDFAETFAVWLKPRSNWQRRYRGWAALKKLEYVDLLMKELAGKKPAVTTKERLDPLSSLKQTLRSYYEDKRALYAPQMPDAYDRELIEIFTQGAPTATGESAAVFLRRHRKEIRQLVSRWTGEYQLTLDAVLKDMIANCKRLSLRAVGSEHTLKMDFAILLTVKTMQYALRGREWHPL